MGSYIVLLNVIDADRTDAYIRSGHPVRKFDWVGSWASASMDLYKEDHFSLQGGNFVVLGGTSKHILGTSHGKIHLNFLIAQLWIRIANRIFKVIE